MTELPIYDKSHRVIAYIDLCIGKGDIQDATQFLNIHMKGIMQHGHNKNKS